MKALQTSEVRKVAGGTKLPKLQGDVVKETIGDQTGFLYYNGAKYVWYRVGQAPSAAVSK